eukprot:4741604-Prymnesium_polylepis.2
MAFMSTSRHRQTPIDYMQGPQADDPQHANNVLWALQPQPESDVGFHCGASIESLSQFAGEGEVLYPPCTLLRVKQQPRGNSIMRSLERGLNSAKSLVDAKPASAPAAGGLPATVGNFDAKVVSEGGKNF